MTSHPALDSAEQDELFRWLTQHRPVIAWPTVALFSSFVALFIGSITLALRGVISAPVSIALSTVASYISYSIVHEAAHNAISTNKPLNDWIGRISLLGISITPFFETYRFLHLVHHRHTNDPVKDPDAFCGHGPAWNLPLRWCVMDVAYVLTYFRLGTYNGRPKGERTEFWLAFVFSLLVLGVVFKMGWGEPFLLLYFLPTRLGLFLLAFAFDFLPHHPHQVTVQDSVFRATSNRIGLEWLLSPLFICQNYHLSHHLYPSVPFYRYRRVWLARKRYHDSNHPAIVAPFGLRPVSDLDAPLANATAPAA